MLRKLPEGEVWIDLKQKQVVIGGEVCLRKGPLEMLACSPHTKEHESIIQAHAKSFIVHTALLMVELHQHAEASATLHTLAKQFLGQKGKWVASFSMLFLFYSLCAAYIAGGGAQFGERISQFTGLEITSTTSTVIFTLVVAAVVTIGTGTVDKVNRVLFAIKLIAMAWF